MNNSELLVMFFGVIGVVCLLFPKFIKILYTEVSSLGADPSANSSGMSNVNGKHHVIRLVGVGILLMLSILYYF